MIGAFAAAVHVVFMIIAWGFVMRKYGILFVDDDYRLLKSFSRMLSPRFYVKIATDAVSAMEILEDEHDFTIVISDYKMPIMSGVDLLSNIKDKYPDMIRILLTGYADLNVALEAVNEGNIFRILQKPCNPKAMAKAIMDGIDIYEKGQAMHELLESTVQESLGIFGDLVSLVKPDVFGRITRILPYVRHMAREMIPSALWEVSTGTRLSMLGFITLPDEIVQKDLNGIALSASEQKLFNEHPAFSSSFIAKIPRMDNVSRIIAYQEKRYDGTGVPKDKLQKKDIPLGARILKACLDLDRHVCSGMGHGEALNALSANEDWYDPDVLGYLFTALGDQPVLQERQIYMNGLEPGMILTADIVAVKGNTELKLLAAGQELSEMSIAYLRHYTLNYRVPEPIKIMEAPFCKL